MVLILWQVRKLEQAKAKDNDTLSEIVEFTVKEKPAADLSTVKANIVDYGPYSHSSGDTLTLNANGTGLMEFYRDNTYTFNWDIEANTDGTYKLILSNLNCTVSGGYYKLTRNYGSGVISANLKTIALTYYDGYEGAIENLTAENYQQLNQQNKIIEVKIVSSPDTILFSTFNL